MDIKLVKQLADLMEERGLSKVEMCDGEKKILLSRELSGTYVAAPPAPVPAAPAAVEAPAVAVVEAKAEGEELTAPLVGVAYLAPSPDANPFVQVGDKVQKGQVLCIIEAMKVMNEFTAPRAGVVAEICVENEQLVEFGQVLIRLQ